MKNQIKILLLVSFVFPFISDAENSLPASHQTIPQANTKGRYFADAPAADPIIVGKYRLSDFTRNGEGGEMMIQVRARDKFKTVLDYLKDLKDGNMKVLFPIDSQIPQILIIAVKVPPNTKAKDLKTVLRHPDVQSIEPNEVFSSP